MAEAEKKSFLDKRDMVWDTRLLYNLMYLSCGWSLNDGYQYWIHGDHKKAIGYLAPNAGLVLCALGKEYWDRIKERREQRSKMRGLDNE